MGIVVCGVSPFCTVAPTLLMGYWFLEIIFSVAKYSIIKLSMVCVFNMSSLINDTVVYIIENKFTILKETYFIAERTFLTPYVDEQARLCFTRDKHRD